MNYDPKSGQITLHITVTPKTLIEDMTAIFTATTTDMIIVEEEGTFATSNIFECRMMRRAYTSC